MRLFGREPALWLTLIAIIIKLIAAFWIDLSVLQQSALNAIAAAACGILIAAIVGDGINAAILGFIQAVLALAIGFGLHIDPDNQALIMAAAATIAAMFVRTQATAPVTHSQAV